MATKSIEEDYGRGFGNLGGDLQEEPQSLVGVVRRRVHPAGLPAALDSLLLLHPRRHAQVHVGRPSLLSPTHVTVQHVRGPCQSGFTPQRAKGLFQEGLSGTHNNYRPFYSYPYVLLPGQRSNPKYYPQFHLLNLFKKEGRSHSGIAVIELRIVTEQGLIDKLQDGLLRQDSHTSLCPPLDDRKLIFDWFERATTTYCEVVENPRLSPEEHPKPPNPVQGWLGLFEKRGRFRRLWIRTGHYLAGGRCRAEPAATDADGRRGGRLPRCGHGIRCTKQRDHQFCLPQQRSSDESFRHHSLQLAH